MESECNTIFTFLWETASGFRLSSFRKYSFELTGYRLQKNCKQNISIDFCLTKIIQPEAFNEFEEDLFRFEEASCFCFVSVKFQLSTARNVYDAFSQSIMWSNCGDFMVDNIFNENGYEI